MLQVGSPSVFIGIWMFFKLKFCFQNDWFVLSEKSTMLTLFDQHKNSNFHGFLRSYLTTMCLGLLLVKNLTHLSVWTTWKGFCHDFVGVGLTWIEVSEN